MGYGRLAFVEAQHYEWWRIFVVSAMIYGVDAAILMNPKVQASGRNGYVCQSLCEDTVNHLTLSYGSYA